MPKAAYSGTALATAPCELAEMSSAPVRSAVSIAASSPSWAEGATCTSMRPLVLALSTSANFTAASWRGLPGAAPWPSVSFTVCAWAASESSVPAARAIVLRMKFLRCMFCLL